jgi:hypothetical protein
MIYQIEANANLNEIETRLQDSAVKHHFGIIAIHDLKATLMAKGVDLNMDCRLAKRDEAALSREDFGAEFPAVLAGHSALEAFHDRAHWRVVRREVFGAILDRDAGPDAPVFVVRSLVGFLESTPPADVVHEDRTKSPPGRFRLFGGGPAVHPGLECPRRSCQRP